MDAVDWGDASLDKGVLEGWGRKDLERQVEGVLVWVDHVAWIFLLVECLSLFWGLSTCL